MLSNCPAEVPRRWSTSRLCSLLDHAIFSCDVGAKKPDSRIYREACFRLQAAPEECVYVADGDGGELHAAEDLGMVAVQVMNEDPRHLVDPEVWSGPKIRDLHELVGLLEVAGDRPE
jgi:putative hydrolase of the HAD superfamily